MPVRYYTVDGLPFFGEPDGFNAKGYPYVMRPVRLGEAPTRHRLYTREHLERLGKPVFGSNERQSSLFSSCNAG